MDGGIKDLLIHDVEGQDTYNIIIKCESIYILKYIN